MRSLQVPSSRYSYRDRELSEHECFDITDAYCFSWLRVTKSEIGLLFVGLSVLVGVIFISGVRHWEGDLIKGAGNRSSVGTLVERTTGFVVLAKMDIAATKTVVDSFSAVLNREPAAMRKPMTYD